MRSALALTASVCLVAAEPQAIEFTKNAEKQLCSSGTAITSANQCQQAGIQMNLDLTTSEVQTQNTPMAAPGCYYLKVPARRSDTGYAVKQLWYNSNSYGVAEYDQYPLCAEDKGEYSDDKYYCHMAYCIKSP